MASIIRRVLRAQHPKLLQLREKTQLHRVWAHPGRHGSSPGDRYVDREQEAVLGVVDNLDLGFVALPFRGVSFDPDHLLICRELVGVPVLRHDGFSGEVMVEGGQVDGLVDLDA